MKQIKIIGHLVVAALMMLTSCSSQEEKHFDIGAVTINPEEIVLVDSSTVSNPADRLYDMSMTIDTIRSGVYHMRLVLSADKTQRIRDLKIKLRFSGKAETNDIKKSFHWVPNLKKHASHFISQHSFRSPAIILTNDSTSVSIIPDVEKMKVYDKTPYYLDVDFGTDGTSVTYGLSNYNVDQHVYYERKDSLFTLPEKIELGLYVISSDKSSPLDILKQTNSFLWETFATSYLDSLSPQVLPFRNYASAGYDMAMRHYWVNGSTHSTGGITLSTLQDKETGIYRGREFKDDLWFHSWFNNARTAYGLYLWGKETKNKLWMDKAISTMNLLLTSPQQKGFFPTIWVPGNKWIASGQGGGPALFHVPDNAWTAIWLLRFNDELQRLPGADSFLNAFVKGLLKTQLANGSFPARLHVANLSPDDALQNSASGSMATWFLGEMILRKKLSPDLENEAREAVKRSLSFLEHEILPTLRFQDFEVFYSCAPNAIGDFDSLTWSNPHNTLSIQWSAEAFLKAYQISNDKHDLEQAEYCLNVLSLYQQVWNPPFIDYYAFGGFGVQNTDAEWSDARQAQFAETYLNFFQVTGNTEYLERSIAACRASFALMAIPENKNISPQNYQGTSYNGEFIGAMAENFGHSGHNRRSGQSGFHWGTGSALTTAAILKTTLGDIYLDSRSKTARGIDGIVVQKSDWNNTIHLSTKKLRGVDNPLIKSDVPIEKKVILHNGLQH